MPQAHTTNTKLYVYAVSILIGTVIQVLLPIPWLRGRDGRLRLVIDWRDPAVAQTFELMLPVTLGLGLINVNAVIDTFFASRLIDANLAPKAIDKAFRVYMLPQGMFSVAVATVLFPSLARLASRARHGRLPPHLRAGTAPDRVPARARERRVRRSRGADRAPALPARPVRVFADDRWSRERSPRSASGSPSTGRC